MNILSSILLTTISGICTIFGYFFIYIKKSTNIVISLSLSLTSGIMLCVSIIDLIPNAITLLSLKYKYFYIILFIFIGILLSYIINKIEDKTSNSKLYKLGIISTITIILHNIPEGIITYISASNNIKLGIKMAFSIALHNIPEGIMVSIPIYYSTKNKNKALIYTIISGLSEVIGAVISILFLYKYINSNILSFIYLITAGIMINISLKDYIESLKYSKKYTYIYFILGIIIILISNLLI